MSDLTYQQMIGCSRLAEADKQRILRLLQLLEKSSTSMEPWELRAAREASGLSRGQAAMLLGVTAATIFAWERDGVMGMPAAVTRSIDRVYGLDRPVDSAVDSAKEHA